MNKKAVLLLPLLLGLPLVEAGIWGSSQVMKLKAGQEKVSCNFWVYSTIPEETAEECLYSLSFPHLSPFIKEVTPNDFSLKEIPCPKVNSTTPQSEVSTLEKARMDCLTKVCEGGDAESCKRLCVTFTGPTDWKSCVTNLFKNETEKSIPGCPVSLGEKEREFTGGVADTIRVNRATVSNAVKFRILYTPYNILPPLLVLGLVVAIGTVVFFIFKFKD